MVLPPRLERGTHALKGRCSTNWATGAYKRDLGFIIRKDCPYSGLKSVHPFGLYGFKVSQPHIIFLAFAPVEQVMGIEPTSSAWKADIIADILHLHIKWLVVFSACMPLAWAPCFSPRRARPLRTNCGVTPTVSLVGQILRKQVQPYILPYIALLSFSTYFIPSTSLLVDPQC